MNKTFKISLVCAGIFLAGGVSGVLGTLRYNELRRASHRPNAESFGPNQMQRFSEALKLTEKQQEQIQPILNQTADELRKLRKESYRSSAALIAKMEARMAELLTPEQRERLAVMQTEQRERIKQRMSDPNRRPEGGDRGPRQPPPEEPTN